MTGARGWYGSEVFVVTSPSKPTERPATRVSPHVNEALGVTMTCTGTPARPTPFCCEPGAAPAPRRLGKREDGEHLSGAPTLGPPGPRFCPRAWPVAL